MSPRLELTGETFGTWRVLESAPARRGKSYWRCRCACGVEAVVRTGHLRSGRSRSCGDALHQRSRAVHAGGGVRGAGELLPGGDDMRRIEASDGAPEVQGAFTAFEEGAGAAVRGGAVLGGIADGHLDHGGGEELRGRDIGGRGLLGEDARGHEAQDSAPRVVDADPLADDSPAVLRANGWHWSATLHTWVRNVTPPAPREHDRARTSDDYDPFEG